MLRSLALCLALSSCMTATAFRHPGQRIPTYAYAIDCSVAAAGLAESTLAFSEHSAALTALGLAAFFAVMVPPAFAPEFLP